MININKYIPLKAFWALTLKLVRYAGIICSDNIAQIINNITLNVIRKYMLKLDATNTIVWPGTPMVSKTGESSYSLGLGCNLLNNFYNFAKIFRKNGVEAKLFLDPLFADTFVTSHPAWEETTYLAEKMPANISEISKWDYPDFLKSANWSADNYSTLSDGIHIGRMNHMLRDAGITISNQWDYITYYTVIPNSELLALFNSVDVVLASGVHIGVASYSHTPYVTFPYGADLFSLPFEDTEIGWMQARGFKKAHRHIASGALMIDHLKHLGIPSNRIHLLPMMIDTDEYAPMEDNPVRDELRAMYPGKTIFFIGARQNWVWKGSDRLLRAISRILRERDDAMFLSVWYGQDVDRSNALLEKLGANNGFRKVGVMSKKTLRMYIDAADVCFDQFTHGGLGAFALEAMSLGTSLVTYYNRSKHFDFAEDPPLLNAFSEDEIYESIRWTLDNSANLKEHGRLCRDWVIRYHGHTSLWDSYDEVLRGAVQEKRYRQ